MKHSDLNWTRLIELGKKLVGKSYVMGAETNLADPDPDHIKEIDCSELVEWLYAQLKKIDGSSSGISMPDGSYNQAKIVRRLAFLPNDPKTDVLLIGDLGFKWHPDTESIHHVGIFLGGDTVLEAKGKSWGVILTPYAKYVDSPDFAFWGRHKSIEDA